MKPPIGYARIPGVTDLQAIHLFEDASYWTIQRRELVQWFNDRAPSFAEGYVGSVRLLHTPDFPARVHLICHIVRDIYRLLPAALGVQILPTRPEGLLGIVDEISTRWKQFPPNDTERAGTISSDVGISAQVHESLVRLVEKTKELADQPKIGHQLAIALYRSFDRQVGEFIPRWTIDLFNKEHQFFIRKAHLASSLDKVPSDDGLLEHFEAFELAFHSLVGPYFTGKEELDAILQDTNTTTD